MVENCDFLKRLRNVHLEKSATAGGLCPSRSPKTAKTPLKVHLRLRFQNLGKPRTAGLCGRAAGACDCGPLSCFLFRPRKSRERRRKCSHTNVSNALVTRTSRLSQTLLQTPLPCFHASINEYYTAKNGLGTIAPRLLSQVKVGTHLGSLRKIAHSGSQGETGAFPPSATARSCAVSEIPFSPPRFYIHTFPGSL